VATFNKNFRTKQGIASEGNVDVTGELTTTGNITGLYLRSSNSSGDEGGEILLYKPATNSTIAGTGVTVDVFQNRLRFFEQGGTARGYYLDITAGGTNASTNLASAGGTTTNALTIGTGLSGTSFNGSAAVTIAIDSTVATTSSTQTLTNKTISGSSNTLSNIANSSLTNSSVTVNGTSIALGASGTVTVPISTGVSGLGTGVATALAVNVGSAGAPLVNGGVLGTPSSGTLTNATGLPISTGVSGLGTGIATLLGTPSSANLAAAITDETGSGSLVFGTSPSLTTPTIGGGGANFSGSVSGTTNVRASSAAGSTTITLPAVTGTVITTGDTGTVTSTIIANDTIVNADINSSAAIAVSKLAASTISGVTLGSNLNTLTISTGLSGTSYNGSSAVTIAIDSTVATLTGTQTLTNKTVNLTSNTLTGTIAQFNTALSDADFATLAGTETLTNKTISVDSNTVSGIAASSFVLSNASGNIDGSAAQKAIPTGTVVGTSDSQTLTNKTLGSSTALSADLSAATFKITGLGTPTASTDAATKQYVDDVAQGLHIHPSVVAGTTANLTATYSNGTSGVGATLTNSGTLVAFSIDGISPAQNDRVLVKNQTTQLQNGIYTLTTVGSGSVAWVLTRATDMDQSVEVDGGDFVFVTSGTTLDNTGWVQTETGVTIGTTSLIFTQFSGAGTYSAGNGLTLTGSTFTINTAITADLSTAQTLTNKTLTSPTLTTPSIGVATGTSFNSITGLSSTTPSANGSAAVGTATTTARADHVHPTTGLGLTSGTLAQFAATTSAQLAGVISDETGSGLLVFATSPTLTTPNIGVATGTSFNSITGLSSTTPSANGTAAVGTATTTARADHVHPTTGLGLTSGTLAQFAATTSAQLAGVISDETGSGALVFATSPTLVTPTLGVASATSINKVTITAPATGSTLTIIDGKTLTASNTLTFNGTDASTVAFGTGGTVAYTNVATLSSLSSIGTVATGTWNATAIGAIYGGTGLTSYTTGDIIVASATNTLSKLAAVTSGYVLTSNGAGTAPSWQVAGGGSSLPSQTGNAGKLLTTDGTSASWSSTLTGQLQLTLANNTATGGGQLYLNGATGNRIDFNLNGIAAPAFTTRSAGTKIVLSPNIGASTVDYAIGIESGAIWQSVPSSGAFKWYGGTTVVATLTGAGAFSAVTKSFDIEHPTKPDMRLRYGSLEGPENGVYVRGKSENKTIQLPDYWTGLVHEDSITVNLTAIGSGTLYVKEIINNTVIVGGTAKEFFFTIYGERKDVDKLTVEY
jgi:hypothetical protein